MDNERTPVLEGSMHLDFAAILNNLNLKNVRFCLGTLSPAQYPHERPANP